MPNYNVCPKCEQISPIRLAPGEVCAACKSADQWDPSTIITLGNSKSSGKQEGNDRLAEPPNKYIMLPSVLGIILAACATALVVQYFFRGGHHDPPWILFARIKTALGAAIGLSILAIVVNFIAFIVMKNRAEIRRRVVQAVFALSIAFAIVIAIISFGHWVNYWLLNIPVIKIEISGEYHPSPHSRPIPPEHRRMYNSAALLFPENGHRTFRRPIAQSGVLIRAIDDSVWVIAHWPFEEIFSRRRQVEKQASQESVWVQFAHGKGKEYGQLSQISNKIPTLATMLLDDTKPSDAAEIHPLAEAFIIGDEVYTLANPLHSHWRVQEGVILNREKFKMNGHTFTVLHTTLPYKANRQGIGVFDKDGKIIGIMLGYDEDGQTTAVLSLPPNMFHTLVPIAQKDK